MKLLASDFDGTLYFHDLENHFKKEDIIAIKKFQEAGNKFGVCTGRPYKGITGFMSKDINIDFYITNSGACVYDQDGSILLKNDMPHAGVKQLLNLYSLQRTVIMCADHVYTRNDTEKMFNNAPFRKDYVNQDLSDEIVFGVSFHFEENEAANKAVNYIRENIDGITAYQNINDVDCVADGCSKQTGIKNLQKLLHISKDDVACIGDSFNDLPMLTAFENSYTFIYSPESVQKQAKHIVAQLCYAIEDLMK